INLQLFRPPRFHFELVGSSSLGRGEPSREHPEWRTRDVVQSGLVAERDRRRISAMLAAGTDFAMEASPAAPFGGLVHEFPDDVTMKKRERVVFQNAFPKIWRENLVDVIAREPEGCLRKIVGAEREELCLFGNLVGHQRGTWQLDHSADQVINLLLFFCKDF